VNLKGNAISNNEFKRSFLFCYCEPAEGGRGNLNSSVIARAPVGSPWQSSPLSLRAFCTAEGVAISFSNPVGLENVLAKADLGSQTKGLRTVLAKANLLFNGMY
jgi:hypothetical protein